MKLSSRHTVAACFCGIVVQAIVINFSPLLFVTFEEQFGITLSKISTLIAVSFITQLLMDMSASAFPRVFNNRAMVVIGQLSSAAGLCGFAILPFVMPAFWGLLISTVVASFGAGIIEIMGNPIIEACPIKNKNKILTFFHSGYCWGLLLTVLLSTLFFSLFGIENWRILACLWAAVPALNALYFVFVPINKIYSEPKEAKSGASRFRTVLFWAFFMIMLCGGAAEQAMSQWASSFAEQGLGIPKAIGDLLGPCMFALFMGASRIIYAKFSEKINLAAFMIISSALCVGAYLLSALSPAALPLLSLVGCGICGFSVGIMWPGTLCLANEKMPNGGVKMFALLALAGDVGCTLGPSAVGSIADSLGGNIKLSLAFSATFPALILVFMGVIYLNSKRKSERNI